MRASAMAQVTSDSRLSSLFVLNCIDLDPAIGRYHLDRSTASVQVCLDAGWSSFPTALYFFGCDVKSPNIALVTAIDGPGLEIG